MFENLKVQSHLQYIFLQWQCNFIENRTINVKPDFHSRFSLVASESFRIGHAQSGVKRIEQDEKISFALFAFKVQIFQLLRNFLTAKPIRLLSGATWTFTKIKKFSPNGRLTALSGLREDRPQYILKTRIIQLQIRFRLRHFFAGNLRKWRLIFLSRYFSLTTNRVSNRRRV